MISRHINPNGELEIYSDNRLLATVTDGIDTDEFVEDILFGMGYIWNNDGSITKDACKECTRKCAQFVCCMCENKELCECTKRKKD